MAEQNTQTQLDFAQNTKYISGQYIICKDDYTAFVVIKTGETLIFNCFLIDKDGLTLGRVYYNEGIKSTNISEQYSDLQDYFVNQIIEDSKTITKN